MQNLPTDSLYKFCALSGILILLVSLYFPIKIIETIHSKILANTLEIKRIGIETEHQEYKFGIIDTKVREILKSKGLTLDQINKEIDNYLKTVDTTYALKIKTAEAGIINKENKRLNDKLLLITIICAVGDAIGMFLALYGFFNWYFKIQVYQDRIIKKQTE